MRWVVAAMLFAFPMLTSAFDQPLDGDKLVIRWDDGGAAGARKRLLFVSRDPALLTPDVGSADDPSLGSPAGAIIDVVLAGVGTFHRVVAPGFGKPGWRVRDGGRSVFKYGNPTTGPGDDVARLVIKEGRMLKLVLKGLADDPLPLDAPLGAVGIRITTGELSNCALFGDAAVLRDLPGRFVARGATGEALADCSLATLGADPCDEQTGLVCGGECPPGTVCQTGALEGCFCLPITCGADRCDGICPVGKECRLAGGTCGCVAEGTETCGGPIGFCGGICLQPGAVCNDVYYDDPVTPLVGCACGSPAACGAGGESCPAGFVCDVLSSGTCLPVGP